MVFIGMKWLSRNLSISVIAATAGTLAGLVGDTVLTAFSCHAVPSSGTDVFNFSPASLSCVATTHAAVAIGIAAAIYAGWLANQRLARPTPCPRRWRLAVPPPGWRRAGLLIACYATVVGVLLAIAQPQWREPETFTVVKPEAASAPQQ